MPTASDVFNGASAALRRLTATLWVGLLLAAAATPASAQTFVLPQFGVTTPTTTPRQYCVKTPNGVCHAFMTQDIGSGVVDYYFTQLGSSFQRSMGQEFHEDVKVTQFQGVDPTGATDSTSGVVLAAANTPAGAVLRFVSVGPGTVYAIHGLQLGTRIHISIDPGVTVRSLDLCSASPSGNTPACGTQRAFSVFQFNPGSDGSVLDGGGTIDGNRAILVNDYIALPRQTQTNGLYVIGTEWNCVTANLTNDITVRNVTAQNCMTFGLAHEGGDRWRAIDDKVLNSSAATFSQLGADVIWRNITEETIGNQVVPTSGTPPVAIPIFAYANNFDDLTSPVIENITLNGYAPLHYDGTSASPGARIGDPYGGAFPLIRLTGGKVSGLFFDGFTHTDGRSVAAAWGIDCNNCIGTNIDAFNMRGCYWCLSVEGPQHVTITNGVLDGQYNIASVSGAFGAVGLWVLPAGQLRGNPGLSSAFDHNNMAPPYGLELDNIFETRSGIGFSQNAGNVHITNSKFMANAAAGWQPWAEAKNGGFPASTAFPVNNTSAANVELSNNGGSGFAAADASSFALSNVIANNNGQEVAAFGSGFPATGHQVGLELISGFNGAKTNVAFRGWTANDTQSGTTAALFSLLPGSTTADANGRNVYTMLVSNSAGVQVGRHYLCKSCGSGGADVNVKVIDLINNKATVVTASPTTFDGSACTVALVGTVAVSAGANLLNGTGTAFSTALNGSSYLLAAGQYLPIGAVNSSNTNQLQLDAAADVAIPAGTSASIIQCSGQGVQSQAWGLTGITSGAGADSNITNISIGDPSTYTTAGNTGGGVNIAPTSLRNDTTPFTPIVSASPGTGVTFASQGGNYRVTGKYLCVNAFVQVNYTGTAPPTQVSLTLPLGTTLQGPETMTGYNASVGTPLFGNGNASTSLNFSSLTGAMVTATGQFLAFNGCVQVQ